MPIDHSFLQKVSLRAASRRTALACLVTWIAMPALGAAGLELTPPDALAQVKAGKLILVDVRTPAEWKQTGVAQGAALLDMQHPKGANGFMDDLLKLTKGDKNAPVALICRTGNRSTQVQRYLESQGFTRVYNITEGMAGSAAGPGWLRRGLPLPSSMHTRSQRPRKRVAWSLLRISWKRRSMVSLPSLATSQVPKVSASPRTEGSR